jgi:broad specificity phosphatase PhoE
MGAQAPCGTLCLSRAHERGWPGRLARVCRERFTDVSTLTLVRHGQAEPFQQKSAALTSLGEAQAAKLAQFWLRNQVRFDEVHAGVLARQTRTEQVIAACFRASDQPWPEARADGAWNEYDAPGVLRHCVPADPRLAALAADFEHARSGPDANRRFQRMFEAAMLCWLEGNMAANGVEPWTVFRERVSGAIRRILEGPPGRRVAVFTSGGPIGFAVHLALQSPPRSFLDVNWRIRNGSVTEFLFDRERFTLDSFNGVPHLDDAALWTYR